MKSNKVIYFWQHWTNNRSWWASCKYSWATPEHRCCRSVSCNRPSSKCTKSFSARASLN